MDDKYNLDDMKYCKICTGLTNGYARFRFYDDTHVICNDCIDVIETGITADELEEIERSDNEHPE